MNKIYDFIVVGGGILGMATARELQSQYPMKSVLVLEKEPKPALHQTGRNSGVIHAGVYYKPGSLKARFCKEGNIATKAFCQQHEIPFDECGKLIVATCEVELQRMHLLADRCKENGIEIQVLDEEQLSEREPNISGLGAIFVPSTGIVNYSHITQNLAELIVEQGSEVIYSAEVTSIEQFADRQTLFTSQGRFQCRYMVSCSGLHADRVARMLGLKPDFRILPFKGEYFLLGEKHNNIVNHLIYPVPNPDLPFLGVHLTKMIDGTVTVGPNAVLVLKREGYGKFEFDLKEALCILFYPGTVKVIFRHFKASLLEFKNSLSKTGYLRLVQKYCKSLKLEDLNNYPSGIRAQAVTPKGHVIDDFLFMHSSRALVVCNAPSPAATSAFPISKYIVQKLSELVTD